MLGRLEELGHARGRNLIVDMRWAEGAPLAEFARNVVAARPDVIVVSSTPAIKEAMAATKNIAIVFPSAGNPVANGLVKSLARPGGLAVARELEQAATAKGLELRHVDAGNADAIRRAFAGFPSESVDALVVAAILVPHRKLLAELAVGHRLPAHLSPHRRDRAPHP